MQVVRAEDLEEGKSKTERSREEHQEEKAHIMDDDMFAVFSYQSDFSLVYPCSSMTLCKSCSRKQPLMSIFTSWERWICLPVCYHGHCAPPKSLYLSSSPFIANLALVLTVLSCSVLFSSYFFLQNKNEAELAGAPKSAALTRSTKSGRAWQGSFVAVIYLLVCLGAIATVIVSYADFNLNEESDVVWKKSFSGAWTPDAPADPSFHTIEEEQQVKTQRLAQASQQNTSSAEAKSIWPLKPTEDPKSRGKFWNLLHLKKYQPQDTSAKGTSVGNRKGQVLPQSTSPYGNIVFPAEDKRDIASGRVHKPAPSSTNLDAIKRYNAILEKTPGRYETSNNVAQKGMPMGAANSAGSANQPRQFNPVQNIANQQSFNPVQNNANQQSFNPVQNNANQQSFAQNGVNQANYQANLQSGYRPPPERLQQMSMQTKMDPFALRNRGGDRDVNRQGLQPFLGQPVRPEEVDRPGQSGQRGPPGYIPGMNMGGNMPPPSFDNNPLAARMRGGLDQRPGPFMRRPPPLN
eukprot:g78975.t1